MSLRTAPCPTCQNTIVFGERKCRKCGMDFDYGPNGPAEPSQADVMESLLMGFAAKTPQAPPPGQTTPTQRPKPPPAPPPAPAMEGLDSGRFSGVGEVEIEDIPGFIDSTLFAAMTPDVVDTVAVPGLDAGRFNAGNVTTRKAAEIESDRANVGEVAQMAAIPGVERSDLLRANLDVAAGAASAGDMLDVSPTRAHPKGVAKKGKGEDGELPRVICTNCGSTHTKPRCPSCATNHPQANS
ncbi:MAG: hypothetical protein Q8O67_28055 [Deltaproteobacteria bacterium]|nr:hypothetical protein [Deltaproteobacteria bacterium]